MFFGYDPGFVARLYLKVATEYSALSEAADDQLMRSYYLRIAEDYMARSDREKQALLKEGSLRRLPPRVKSPDRSLP